MTRFHKYNIYVITLFMMLLPLFLYLNYNIYFLLFSTIDIIVLFLGLSGIIDKITIKPLGKEVIGVSAILQGIIYILLSLCFTYIIIGMFFYIIRGEEFINILSYIFLLFIVLSIFSLFVPTNQNIKFCIAQPWLKRKYQEKIDKITTYIDKNGYDDFIICADIYKFTLVFRYFDTNTQVRIYNSFNDRTVKWFEHKVKEADSTIINDDEINEIFNYLIEQLESKA